MAFPAHNSLKWWKVICYFSNYSSWNSIFNFSISEIERKKQDTLRFALEIRRKRHNFGAQIRQFTASIAVRRWIFHNHSLLISARSNAVAVATTITTNVAWVRKSHWQFRKSPAACQIMSRSRVTFTFILRSPVLRRESYSSLIRSACVDLGG